MSNIGEKTPGGLRAGAAQVEITPKAGVHLSGGIAVFRPAQCVADPLYAKSLVLELGGRRVCIVSLDVTIITQPWSEKIRDAASQFGLDPRPCCFTLPRRIPRLPWATSSLMTISRTCPSRWSGFVGPKTPTASSQVIGRLRRSG